MLKLRPDDHFPHRPMRRFMARLRVGCWIVAVLLGLGLVVTWWKG